MTRLTPAGAGQSERTTRKADNSRCRSQRSKRRILPADLTWTKNRSQAATSITFAKQNIGTIRISLTRWRNRRIQRSGGCAATCRTVPKRMRQTKMMTRSRKMAAYCRGHRTGMSPAREQPRQTESGKERNLSIMLRKHRRMASAPRNMRILPAANWIE